MKLLSKTDFQLASDCPKKLIYKKAYYPTANDTNEYMEMLAQGGYIIGQMATLLYPEGIEIDGTTQECIDKTKELMQQDNVILFEAAIQSGQKLVRVDILVKEGNNLHLIEVKAKSNDSEEDPDVSTKKLAKYIEDVAYQHLVLNEAYPGFNIKCSLFTPDKAKRTTIDGLAGWFSIEKSPKKPEDEIEELPAQQKPRFNKPKVVFKYDQNVNRETFIKQLKDKGILSYKDVTKEVSDLQQEISLRANNLVRILNFGITPADYKINKTCKNCEFKVPNDAKDGFKECWGDMAYTDPHLFDLNSGGSIGHYTKGYYWDELIAAGKSSLYDIDLDRLKNSKGEYGTRAQRQVLQIENTKSNTEWISPVLKSILKEFKYPLHFIDFETYTGALPYYKGMRPYELIAFQWSCHTIKQPGDTPDHAEWIHTGAMFPDENTFPNFEFAKSLMNHIGDTGTPFMWATHENTVLRTILNQMPIFNIQNPVLAGWLTSMTKDKDRDGRWVDMNNMTKQYYFHPYMKGRTSIKKVLPAIWSNFPELHKVPHFMDYAPDKLTEGIVDPYDTLTTGIEFEDMEDDVVHGGTDAMRAYQRIRFDDSLSKTKKDEIRRQLLEYCKLDTMAMVIIAYHWGLK